MLRARRWRWALPLAAAASLRPALGRRAPSRARSDAASVERPSWRRPARSAWRAPPSGTSPALPPRVGGGVVSRVDDGGFFLSPRGEFDPEAEMTATLAAVFAPAPAGKSDVHARCRFAARARWLSARLPLDRVLPPIACAELQAFRAELDPESVSVVHAANYVNNPASAFGHTFLRIKRRRTPEEPGADRPDVGVNYSARTDTKNPLLYAFKGLTGLFPGYFTFEPFDVMVEHYAGHQARDLWEYELALAPDELEALVLHLWELSRARIHYRYLTENCSYYVLAVLDAAAPRLDLARSVNLAVLPGDTIKVIAAHPGLVVRRIPRPSPRSEFLAREGGRSPSDPIGAPDRAHGSMRLGFGTGAATQYGGASRRWPTASRCTIWPIARRRGRARPGPVPGHAAPLRRRARKVTVDGLTFAEVLALPPLNRFEQRPSWRLRAFGTRLRDRACPDCFFHGANGSFGLTLATNDGRFAVFALLDAYAGLSARGDGIGGSSVRIGVGPFGGARARLTGGLVALLTGSASYLPAQDLVGTYDLRATLRGSVAKDVALGLALARPPLSAEVQFGSYVYF